MPPDLIRDFLAWKERHEKNRREAECRFCQEHDDEDDLVAPCKCRGTVAFVHRACLREWIMCQPDGVPCGLRMACMTCHAPYNDRDLGIRVVLDRDEDKVNKRLSDACVDAFLGGVVIATILGAYTFAGGTVLPNGWTWAILFVYTAMRLDKEGIKAWVSRGWILLACLTHSRAAMDYAGWEETDMAYRGVVLMSDWSIGVVVACLAMFFIAQISDMGEEYDKRKAAERV